MGRRSRTGRRRWSWSAVALALVASQLAGLYGTARAADLPVVSIGDATVVEGDTGTTDAVFTVSLSAAATEAVTVGFVTGDQVAIAGEDYVSASGSVTFEPGDTTATFTVGVIGDTVDEPEQEDFLVFLSGGSDVEVADPLAVGAIMDDDVPSVSIGDITVTEGDTGTTDAVFKVSLSAATFSAMTFEWATDDGTALGRGEDYQSVSGVGFINPGDTTTTVTVPVVGDTIDEADETFLVHLWTATNATLGDDLGEGAIEDDDPLPAISIDDVTVIEGDAGTTDAVFTVSLANTSADPVTVDYATSAGTASVGSDFTAAGGTLTFAPGDDSHTVSVPIVGDTVAEPSESMTVDLTNAGNATIADLEGVGTIVDNDAGPPSVSIGDVAVTEGDAGTTDAVFTVSLSHPSALTVTVGASTTSFGATADLNVDYIGNGFNLSFAPNEVSKTVTVQVLGDTLDEEDETFFVVLLPATNATIAKFRGVGTIVDDDAPPMMAIDDVTVTEGDAGTTDAEFTVSLSVASGRPVTVDYATSDDSTTAGADYVATSGTLTFAPGETAKTITVPVKGDTTDEVDEAFVVQLSNLAAATPADTQGRATIVDDDLAVISITDLSVTEGDSGTTDAVFTVSLASPAGQAVTVDFMTHDVPGSVGVDFVSTSGTLSFGVGDQTRTIRVPIIGDTLYEPTEFVFVILSDPTNAVIGDVTGVAQILNDDPVPSQTLSIDDVTVAEGDTGTTDALFTISLSSPSTVPVTVRVGTVDFGATATGFVDYTPSNTELTFAPGEVTKTVTVQVLGDTLDEADEFFFVDLSPASGATVADFRGVGTIVDDDDPPTLSIDDVTVTEGDAGTTDAVFTVSLSVLSGLPVAVDVATADGSATAGADYATVDTTVTFAPGDTTGSVTVPVKGDTVDELAEAFDVALSNPVNATIDDPTGTGTIVDDDLAVISIADLSVTEGDSGTTDAVFTVSLASPAGQAVTVDFMTHDVPGSVGVDFVSTSGTLSFGVGDQTRTIRVPIIGDTLYEPTEFVFVILSDPTNAVIGDVTGVAQILNDDPVPSQTLSIDDVTVAEGDTGTTDALFTISLSSPSTVPVTVRVGTVDFGATATGFVDYTPSNTELTFAPGEVTKTVTVQVLGDTLDEADEFFFVDLSPASGATVADFRGVGTIIDDDGVAQTLSIDDVTVTEGDTGTTDAVFTVSLSAASTETVIVAYATADNGATAGVDYVAKSGTLTFAPGDLAKDVRVPVIGDMLDEPDEGFQVALSNPVNALLPDPSAGGTILDDDATPAISIANAAVTEGDAGTTNLVFTISLSGASAAPISLDVATVAGSATAGVDFTPASGTIQIPSGDTTAQVTIRAAGDVLDEVNETFMVVLTNAINAAIVDGSATGTIVDDDPLPSLSIGDATVTEGNVGTTDAVFTVSLSAPSGRPVSVTYTTADITATAGLDYGPVSGSVTIKAGETTADIVVKVIGDLLDEPDETYTVTLVDPGAAVLSDDRVGIGTILDDDAEPEVSIGDRSVIEGNDGTTPATFTVSLSAPWTDPVTVDWTTVDGTASAGEDYAFATGTATFAPGDTAAQVTISVLGDLLDEFNESYTVELSNPTHATILDGNGTGIIRDDDGLVSVSIDDVGVTEGNGGTTAATFTVSLSGASGKPVSVDFMTADGSAKAGEDYTSRTGLLTIAPGNTSGTITVDVTGDTLFESAEAFQVDLSNPVNATLADASGGATIANDDTAPTIAIDDVSVVEGNAGTTSAGFTVSLSAASGLPVTVGWSTTGIVAVEGEDYAGGSGIVTFDPGDVDKPISIDVYGDTRFEPDETFRVVLANPTGATIADGTGVGTIRNDDVDASADVSIVKFADHDLAANPVPPGQRLVYTLVVTNVGPGTATDMQISDVLPRRSTPDDAQWCEVVAPATTCDTKMGDSYDTATAIPAIEKLGAGDSRRYRIGYTVAPDAPSGYMQNTASIASTSTDPNPANNTASATVLVDVPPVASFTYTPSTPVTGDLVRFNGLGSTDDEGVADYAWSFGDGTFGSGPTPTHTFNTARTYDVSLTVTDVAGGIGTFDQPIQIVNSTAPNGHRVLRGTITQLVPFGPGAAPAQTIVPLAGADVAIGNTRNLRTDAAGAYGATNLSCSTCQVTVRAAGQGQLVSTSVVLGPDPSVTTLDLQVGSAVNELFLEGAAVPPPSGTAGSPTIAIRVYRGGGSGSLLYDSATDLGGPGAFGTYRLGLGRAGGQIGPGQTLRVVLVENGVEVATSNVTVPPLAAGALVLTVPDLVGQDPAPNGHRVLRGTITQLVPFGPGAAPAQTIVPLAGADVAIGNTRNLRTDAAGAYGATNLSCSTCQVTVRAAGQGQLVSTSVVLGPDPSVTTLDLQVGSAVNELFLEGAAVPPPSGTAGSPTIAIRVYRGGGSGSLLYDSATDLGGPGAFGTYRLGLGRAGGQIGPGQTLRVVLVENGVEVATSNVTVPPLAAGALVLTVPDLVGQDPAPNGHRVLRGTITQLVPFGPGAAPAQTIVPLAGADVAIGNTRNLRTDAAGAYGATNLSCSTCQVTVRAAGQGQLVSTSVVLGPDPSVTTLDLQVGSAVNELFLEGAAVPPPSGTAGSPTIAIRVYRGGGSGSLLYDSATDLGGPGAFGTYRLGLGRAGGQIGPGQTLRVVLVENGVEVATSNVTVPPLAAGALVLTVPDLVGQ